VKSNWQHWRIAFARSLRKNDFQTRPALRNTLRAIGNAALAACAMLLVSSGSAQAKINVEMTIDQSSGSTVFGQPVSFTVTLTPDTPGSTPTGAVIFTDNGQQIDSANVMSIGGGQGQASFTTATLAVGTHTINVTYSGDANFNSVTVPVTQTVSKATALTTISTATPTNTFGQPTTFA
jgi:Bacterial Ig-like domain (group 3)